MLKDYYNDGVTKGWIKETYEDWRCAVIRRIEKLYGGTHPNMTDEEIEGYFDREPKSVSIPALYYV